MGAMLAAMRAALVEYQDAEGGGTLRTEVYGGMPTRASVRAYITYLMMSMRDGDAATCVFETKCPRAMRLTTTTAGDELRVAVWTCACLEFERGWRYLIAARGQGGRLVTIDSNGFMEAAALFSWGARLGTREGYADFVAGGAHMNNGTVCRAMELWSMVYVHVVAADGVLASEEIMSGYTTGRSALLAGMDAYLTQALQAVRNDWGADDSLRAVMPAMADEARRLRQWWRVDTAIHMAISVTGGESLALAHLDDVPRSLPPGDPLADAVKVARDAVHARSDWKSPTAGAWNVATAAATGLGIVVPREEPLPLLPHVDVAMDARQHRGPVAFFVGFADALSRRNLI